MPGLVSLADMVEGDELVVTELPDGWMIDAVTTRDGSVSQAFRDPARSAAGSVTVAFGGVDSMAPDGELRRLDGVTWHVTPSASGPTYIAVFDRSFALIGGTGFDAGELDRFVASLRARPVTIERGPPSSHGPPTTVESTVPALSTVPAPSTAAAQSTTEAPSALESPTRTDDGSADVFRPFVADSDVCVSSAARGGDPGSQAIGLLRPFSGAWTWQRFQIVADPDLGVDGRWALVGTIDAADDFDSLRWEGRDVETINGWRVAISTSPSGFADARIDLGGRTDAYVRTYRFDLDSIRELIEGLAVRPADRDVGFDYTAGDRLGGLELVIDQGDEPVTAHLEVLECVIPDVAIIRIGALTGDPLAQFVTILDQPYPYEIGRIGNAAVSISGGRVAGGPRLSDVTDASDDVWTLLLQQRLPSGGPVDGEG
ncbi:MAG: hypothetical protein ABIO83_10070 [Ilumatobacteraceae bacterium]